MSRLQPYVPRCANPEEANCGLELHMQLGSSPSVHDEARYLVITPSTCSWARPLVTRRRCCSRSNSNPSLALALALTPTPNQALLLTLAQIASRDAFHELRTVRQLGYVVACGFRSISRSRGLSVHVQASPRSAVES